MNKKYLLIIILLSVLHLNAQNFIEHSIDNVNGSFTSMRLYDFDHDNNIDIVGIINGSSQVMVWFGSEGGNFDTPIVIEPQSGTPSRDVELLDVNNDGNIDIVTIATVIINGIDFEMLVYYINNGDRTFENFELVDPNVGSSINNFFSIFDVNNDNLDDIVVRRIFTTTSIVYYPNLGNGSFGAAIEIIADQSREVFAQDFNNDNLIDIVLSSGSPQLYINNGDATFTFNTSFNDYPSAQFATLAVSGQLDNNQTPDIIFPNTNFVDTAGVIWYSNDGNANFTFQENITNPNIVDDTYSIAKITDFNNDGNNDIVAGIRFSPGIGIPFWLQDDSSNFTPFIVETNSDNINNSLEVFDFNNDNKTDFIVATEDGKLTWFENNLTLSIDDESFANLNIAPNPSNGIYTITSNQNNSRLKTTVYNTLGQKVITVENSDIINLSSQPSGVYFAKIEDQLNDTKTSRKLIKI